MAKQKSGGYEIMISITYGTVSDQIKGNFILQALVSRANVASRLTVGLVCGLCLCCGT